VNEIVKQKNGKQVYEEREFSSLLNLEEVSLSSSGVNGIFQRLILGNRTLALIYSGQMGMGDHTKVTSASWKCFPLSSFLVSQISFLGLG